MNNERKKGKKKKNRNKEMKHVKEQLIYKKAKDTRQQLNNKEVFQKDLIDSIKKINITMEESNKKSKANRWLKIIPILTSIATVLIAFFSYSVSLDSSKISEKSMQIARENQSLTYDNEIDIIEKIEHFEDTKGKYKMTIPVRVKTTVNSGKAKSVYLVTVDAEESLGYRFLRFTPQKNQDFGLSVEGQKESIKKFPLDFFVFYVDMFNTINYDYIIIFPKYKVLGYEINGENRDKLIMQKSPYETLDNYDLITDTVYKEKTEKYKKDGFRIKSFSEISKDSNEIAGILEKTIHVGKGNQTEESDLFIND